MSEGLAPARAVLPLEAIADVDRELLRLLRALDPEAWNRPASGEWTVREVAAHLLDGNLRRLSLDRDGFVPDIAPPASGGFDDVRDFLDRLNAEWIRAAERLSPRVIADLLEETNARVREHFAATDPEGPAAFPVAWAGQEESPAWLDIAREYTEKWHHQHQVRKAVGAPALDDPDLVEPLLRTLVWALPPAYESVDAEPGTTVAIAAAGIPEIDWALRAEPAGWRLYEAPAGVGASDEVGAAAAVRLEGRLLWRLLLRSDVAAARRAAEAKGPEDLTDPVFGAVSLMVARRGDPA